jgi:hypothetical protein
MWQRLFSLSQTPCDCFYWNVGLQQLAPCNRSCASKAEAEASLFVAEVKKSAGSRRAVSITIPVAR